MVEDTRDEIYSIKGRILSYLKENKNSDELIKADKIQEKFKIKKNTTSEHLCALEKSKLIEREKKGRSKSIKITDLGESYVK